MKVSWERHSTGEAPSLKRPHFWSPPTSPLKAHREQEGLGGRASLNRQAGQGQSFTWASRASQCSFALPPSNIVNFGIPWKGSQFRDLKADACFGDINPVAFLVHQDNHKCSSISFAFILVYTFGKRFAFLPFSIVDWFVLCTHSRTIAIALCMSLIPCIMLKNAYLLGMGGIWWEETVVIIIKNHGLSWHKGETNSKQELRGVDTAGKSNEKWSLLIDKFGRLWMGLLKFCMPRRKPGRVLG